VPLPTFVRLYLQHEELTTLGQVIQIGQLKRRVLLKGKIRTPKLAYAPSKVRLLVSMLSTSRTWSACRRSRDTERTSNSEEDAASTRGSEDSDSASRASLRTYTKQEIVEEAVSDTQRYIGHHHTCHITCHVHVHNHMHMPMPYASCRIPHATCHMTYPGG
jgi:hypothetical protein